MTTTITTNGHTRELVAFYQLPDDAQDWFSDALPDCAPGCVQGSHDETCERYDVMCEPRYVKYRGTWFDALDSQVIGRASAKLRDPLGYNAFGFNVADDSPLVAWNGIQTDSHWSATVFKWARDWDGSLTTEAVVVGSVSLGD